MVNPNEFSILDLAAKVIELTGSKSRIKFMPLPSDDPKQRRPDIAIAGEKLDWSPSTKLDEDLIKTIDHLKKVI